MEAVKLSEMKNASRKETKNLNQVYLLIHRGGQSMGRKILGEALCVSTHSLLSLLSRANQEVKELMKNNKNKKERLA